jgi:hypothetical protein
MVIHYFKVSLSSNFQTIYNCEALLRSIVADLRESFKVYGAYSSDDNYNNSGRSKGFGFMKMERRSSAK